MSLILKRREGDDGCSACSVPSDDEIPINQTHSLRHPNQTDSVFPWHDERRDTTTLIGHFQLDAFFSIVEGHFQLEVNDLTAGVTMHIRQGFLGNPKKGRSNL